jgi:hypothetical protein
MVVSEQKKAILVRLVAKKGNPMLRVKSLKRFATLISICALPLALSHCAHKNTVPFLEDKSQPNIAKVNTTQVTQVVLAGHMHVNLNTQLHHPHLSFRIPKAHAAYTNIRIENHTLYINNTRNSAMPTHYNLTIGKHLHLLSLHGNVSVNARQLNTKQLTIIDASGGRVSLNGQIDAQRIYASQHSHLSIAWVDSPLLVVYANDHAHLNLAGVTKEFYIHLAGNSQLNAQYLRAASVTISSTGISQAKLMPLYSFQGFAHEGSIVYLYHHPKHQNKYTWEAANIFMKSYRP